MTGTDLFLLRHATGGVVYAPLAGAAAAVDTACVARWLAGQREPVVDELAAQATASGGAPSRRKGPFAPAVLGLVITRNCNLACRHCDFRDPLSAISTMSRTTMTTAIHGFADIAADRGLDRLEVHFFGGEPLTAADIVRESVEVARAVAHRHGLETWFEISTNGIADAATVHWVGSNIDRVVLSLDGPPKVHDRLRVTASGDGSGARALDAATAFGEAPCELVLRSCVDDATVDEFPAGIDRLLELLSPSLVSIEPVHGGPGVAGVRPPTAERFCRAFAAARAVADDAGVEIVFSGADLTRRAVSPCGVARDGCIVQPDGDLTACYLPPMTWRRAGLDLSFGSVSEHRIVLDVDRLDRIRSLDVGSSAQCSGCPARWHCAGGCRVRRTVAAGCDDEWCRTVRSVLALELLDACGIDDPESAIAAARNGAWAELEWRGAAG